MIQSAAGGGSYRYLSDGRVTAGRSDTSMNGNLPEDAPFLCFILKSALWPESQPGQTCLSTSLFLAEVFLFNLSRFDVVYTSFSLV